MTVQNNNGEPNNYGEILNRCLQAIERNQATVESCVKRFPEYQELGDLLRMALAVREMPRPMMPAAVMTRTQQQLQAHLRARARAQRASAYRRPAWVRLAVAAGLILILLTLGGVGLVRASDSAMPYDGFLYSVKQIVERADLFFASAQARPGVLMHIAQARLSEVSALAARGQWIENGLMTDLSDSVNNAAVAMSDSAQRTQLSAQAASVVRQAQASGSVSAELADNTLSKLVIPPPDATLPNTATPSEAVVQIPPTATHTLTATLTRTPTGTASATPTATVTSTATPRQASPAATTVVKKLTPTGRPTMTKTPTSTATSTFTPTLKPTLTSTAAPTELFTTAQVSTNIPTGNAVVSPIQTTAAATGEPTGGSGTAEANQTAVATASAALSTPASTAISTEASTAASTGPATQEAAASPTDTLEPTATPTLTSTNTPLPTRTSTSTRTPRPTRTPTRTPTPTFTPTATPTATPTLTNTPEPDTSWLPPTSFKQPPQVSTFDKCLPEGQGGDAELNRNENRTDEGNYQAVSLDNLLNLPWPKDVEGKSRDQWPQNARDFAAKAEGLPITVEGYIAKVEQRGPEAANCNSSADLTLQITVVAHPEAVGDLSKGMMMLITPRVRVNHPGWTPDKLNRLVKARVQISGWLLLDPEHPDDVGKIRASLWEIHPVMQVTVWKDNQWVRLDDYQP